MKINRPLINPTPREVDARLHQKNLEQIEAQRVSREQLSFNADSKKDIFSQMISSLRFRLRRRNDFLEVAPLWKDMAVPFAIVTFVANILLFFVGGILKFGDIPPQVPFFYNSIEEQWIQIDKSIIFIFPIFLSVLFIIQIQLLTTIFKKDRRLTYSIAWIMGFLNVILLITISQIYYLVT